MMSNADLLASKISEAALKFGWLEQLDPASKQEPNDPNALQALMAGSQILANNQAARDDVSVASRGNTSVVSRGNASVMSRGNASVVSRHSTASSRGSNHDISEMEPMDILEMAKSLVTLPCEALLVGEAEQLEMIESMLSAPVPPSLINEIDDDDDDDEEDFEDPFAQESEVEAKNKRASDQVLTALAALLLADENDTNEGNDQQRRRRGKDSSRRGNTKRGKRRTPRKKQQPQEASFDDSTIATDSSSYRSPRSVCSTSVPTDKELLAKGWKKALDSTCGRYYYYTIDHSQVVWENPLESHDDWFSTDDESREAFAQEEEDPFALDPFDLLDEEVN